MSRLRGFLGVLVVLVAASALGGAGARAQQAGGSRTTTTTEDPYYRTTTTTARATTTPTTAKATTTTTTGSGPTTTVPGDAPDPTVPRGPGGGGGGGGSGGGGDAGSSGSPSGGAKPSGGRTTSTTIDGRSGDGSGGVSRVVPDGYQSMINSVRRSRPNGSAPLLTALEPLRALGVPAGRVPLIGMGRFPVAGQASFVDDWWYPRFVPTFHLHQGTDIFAAMGTPVKAPVDGVLRQSNGAVGGLAAYVTQPDGTYFYMAHLAGFVEGQTSGQKVKTGDVVGFVGDSGNARGGAPHVHLQIHPRGGGPVNPKPFLDRFLAEAMANVPALIEAHGGDDKAAEVATAVPSRAAKASRTIVDRPAVTPRSQLLWASAASPTGGVLRLAEAELVESSRHVDWSALARTQVARRAEWEVADRRAQVLLAPLTPPALAAFMQLATATPASHLVALGPVSSR